jgi:acyl-CoA thioesterase YciA
VSKTGNTSLTIKIERWARRARGADTVPIKVTEGLFTYVKVDAGGKAQPISPA